MVVQCIELKIFISIAAEVLEDDFLTERDYFNEIALKTI